ncbi:UNVERIFIED_CONTAM: 50S ribosomal protein L24 [Sesamum calycinum]|uniref:50S ribosomal protein L24 n=1 Tax=Sesamum calycinum TaxID=2727403 RepID=A0AAW2LYF0_9LAMI
MGWKAAQKLIHHWKVLRGDNVVIIRGKDRGETGTVKRVIRSQNRVIVEGKNLVKKHIKQGQGHEGGIFSVEAPLHVSNVQVIDPVTGKPCKVGIKYLEDGTKVRVSRGIGASGSMIPRPEILKIRSTPRQLLCCFVLWFMPPRAERWYQLVGPKDTPMEFVLEKTYDAKTGAAGAWFSQLRFFTVSLAIPVVFVDWSITSWDFVTFFSIHFECLLAAFSVKLAIL